MEKALVSAEHLETLNAAFDAFTEIAIDQIHRSFRGNPCISKEEARDIVRKSMFFLTDEAFDAFYRWAKWCVSKGA